MTWPTAQAAADAIRDIIRAPHPSKFRRVFNADTLLRLVELLDLPPVDDPVRDAAKALLAARDAEADAIVEDASVYDAACSATWRAHHALGEALASTPPSVAIELQRTREHMALQGGQLVRLGIALRLARVWAFSDIELPDSAVIKRFLAGWVDDGSWPMLSWPDELLAVAGWLRDQGFDNIGGAIGVWLTSNRDDDPKLGKDFAR
jgi:hypothetical protein